MSRLGGLSIRLKLVINFVVVSIVMLGITAVAWSNIKRLSESISSLAASVTSVDSASGSAGPNAQNLAAQAQAAAGSAEMAVIIFGAGGFLVTLAIGTFGAIALTRPLQRVGEDATKVADGDLDQSIDTNAGGEVGVITRALAAIVTTMKEARDVAALMATGDTRMDITPRSERDVLLTSIKALNEGRRKSVGGTLRTADKLYTAGNKLTTIADFANSATAQMSETMHQVAQGNHEQSVAITAITQSVQHLDGEIDSIASGAANQAGAIDDTSAKVTLMSNGVQLVRENYQPAAEAAASVTTMATTGSETVAQTIAGVRSIQNTLSDSASKVRTLGDLSQKIGAIVETIDDIAGQTNLLALNAAIEAARAGEHGKGFAVVADEVRKLAERSSRATKEIAELISTVQSGTMNAVQAMERGMAEVDKGMSLAEQSGAVLETIVGAVGNAGSRFDQIAKAIDDMEIACGEVVNSVAVVAQIAASNAGATERMATDSAEVTKAIEQIAAISQENTASAEEVSATTDQLSEQMASVVESARELNQIAEELRGTVAHFKLRDEDLHQSEPVMRRRQTDWAGKDSAHSTQTRIA